MDLNSETFQNLGVVHAMVLILRCETALRLKKSHGVLRANLEGRTAKNSAEQL